MKIRILLYGLVLLILACKNNGNSNLDNEIKTTNSNTQLDSILQIFNKIDRNKELLVSTKTEDLNEEFSINAKNLNNKAIELYSGVSGEAVTSKDSLNFESALRMLNKAINIDPQYYLAYANKATILSMLKRYNEAIETIEQIIKIRPDYAEGIAGQGFLYEKIGDNKKATEKYNCAIDAYIRRLNDPCKIKKKVNIQADIAFMLLFTSGKETATQLIDTIVARNPDNKVANYMKENILSFNRKEFIKSY